MHDDFHAIIGQSEEMMRLDDLHGLVRQGRAVHADLVAHPPGGMIERLGDARPLQPVGWPVAEWPPRGGENQPSQRRFAPRDALQHGAVLAVDRNQLAASGEGRGAHQFSRHHQRFLVGERHSLAGLQGRERGRESGESHHRVDDDPGLRMRRRLDQTGRTGTAHQAREIRLPFLDLLGEQRGIRAGGQRSERKPVGVPRQHIERAGPDRAGGSQNRHALKGHSTPNPRNNSVVTGSTKYSESNRSITPPWPGISAPESFTPASRLKSDSTRSPSCATTEITRPITAASSSGMGWPSGVSTSGTYASAVATPPNRPATLPERVLPGLISGQSLGPPIAFPPHIAKLSHNQVTASGKNTRPAPASERSGPPANRIRSSAEGSKPRKKGPSSVRAAAASGRCPGPRRNRTNVSTSTGTSRTADRKSTRL